MSNALTWGTAVLLALALAVVLRFRRRVRAYRASLEKIVQGILLLRRMAGRSPRLVPLPGDSPDLLPLEQAEPDLEAADLHVVGDVHELGEDGKPAAAMRWFVSGDGTVFGWLGVRPGRAGDAPDLGGPGRRARHDPARSPRPFHGHTADGRA